MIVDLWNYSDILSMWLAAISTILDIFSKLESRRQIEPIFAGVNPFLKSASIASMMSPPAGKLSKTI